MVEGVGREEVLLLELTMKSLRSYLCTPFSSFSPVSVVSERPKDENNWSEETGDYGRKFNKLIEEKVCVCGRLYRGS